MKSHIKNLEECAKLLQIEIPEDLVKRTVEEVYQEIKKVAKVPGFRAGQAPRDLLEKHHSKFAEEEALKRLIPEGYRKAVENHKISPIGTPEVFNINFQTGKPLTFEARINTRPNIKLKNYKRIRVKKKRISVTPEEIQETLSRLRNMYARYKDVERPVKKGDYAVCDVEAFMEGKPITKKNKDMWIAADKEASLLGMGEELVGLLKGQTKEIETKLPDSYPDKKYAGKSAKFVILVNGVKERGLPELNEDFAKGLNAQNVDALRKEVESQLFERKENNLKTDMQNQILERLLKDNRFSPPSSLVKSQKEVLAKRLESELLERRLGKDEVENKIKELDKRLTQDAEDKVRIYFILDDIAAKENVEVIPKDVEERIKSIAASTNQPLDEVRKYYEKENLLAGLGEEIKEAKVLELLLKEADITEVS